VTHTKAAGWPLRRAYCGVAADTHRDRRQQEREIPGEFAGAGMHVVDAEDLMIDDPFDQVEEAPANEQ
jgi:hypothetical protein